MTRNNEARDKSDNLPEMVPTMNVLLFMTLGLSTIVLIVSGYGCDRSRTVLNSSRGIISDGSGIGKNYTADTHCEWLIVGNDTHRYMNNYPGFEYRAQINLNG